MTTEGRAFLASLILHLLIAGCAVSFAAFTRKPETPVFVDFTMEQGRHADRSAIKGNSGAPMPSVYPKGSTTSKQKELTKRQPIKTLPAPEAPVSSTGPITQSAGATPSNSIKASLTGKTGKGEKIISTASGESIPGKVNGSHGESVESQKARYLKEHFVYIRNLIAGNLRYPGKARRFGWSGKLAVEFVVLETGEVDRIRVVKSSGIALLDSDAEETIRRSAPFPKPPVSARLIIPVEYALE